jgi:predicted amidohydrolase
MVCSNGILGGSPATPAGWQAIDTDFGGIAHGKASPVAEFAAAERIQELARASRAHVIIFPETVVPMWIEASSLFWEQTLADLGASGKIVAFGAGLPIAGRPGDSPAAPQKIPPLADASFLLTTAAEGVSPAYHNVVVIQGAQTGVFFQRIPIPLGMWRPFSSSGVPLNLARRGTIQLAGKRAAVLICYEQLLTWPALQSLLEHPSILIAVANDYWATNTPIRRCQNAAVRTWGRLFRLPVLSATNQ